MFYRMLNTPNKIEFYFRKIGYGLKIPKYDSA